MSLGTFKKPFVYDETTGKMRLLESGETVVTGADTIAQTADGAIAAGQVVSGTGVASTVHLTDAESATDACAVVGVACEDIADTASGGIVYDGPVTLATAVWDARTGDTGGLTPGVTYWVDGPSPGQLTLTPLTPTTTPTWVIKVGVALTSDTLLVGLGDPFRIQTT